MDMEGKKHYFIYCLNAPFVQEYWIHIGLFPNLSDEPYEILNSFRIQLQVQFYMEIIIIMSWSIWMAKHDWIFKGITPSVLDALFCFKTIFTQVILRVKED
uniref:Uncharacterized protein n=1 Tax=Setaria viridis TaxID=4556 RepID=A0A4U6UJX2_SETVI|nr:hypothetical protein SEVIR_5G149200v2 [Setaria viridis]